MNKTRLGQKQRGDLVIRFNARLKFPCALAVASTPASIGWSVARATGASAGVSSSRSASPAFDSGWSSGTTRSSPNQRWNQAPGSVTVQPVMFTVWPLVIEVLSMITSPPPPVAVTLPCSWQVVPALSTMR